MGHFMTDWATRRDATRVGHRAVHRRETTTTRAWMRRRACVRSVVVYVRWGGERTSSGVDARSRRRATRRGLICFDLI